MHQGSPLFRSFAHCHAASTVVPLLPMATFTTSIQPNLGHPRTRLRLLPPSTPFWCQGTHSFFPQAQTISIFSDLVTHSLPFYYSSPKQTSIQTLFIWDTPTKVLKHFTSRTFTFRLSALLILHASAPYNAVGTITPSCGHFMTFIPNPLLLNTLFSA